MLTTVAGVYENGQIILEETPQITQSAKVLVTFLEDITEQPLKKRVIGSMAGKMSIPDDFDEPLDDLKEYMY
jgi:hypothetical protein